MEGSVCVRVCRVKREAGIMEVDGDRFERLVDASHGKDVCGVVREIGITKKQFRIYCLHNGLIDGKFWKFSEIAGHYRRYEQSVCRTYRTVEEKVDAWVRAQACTRGRAL